MARILIIDDDELFVIGCQQMLAQAGHEVLTASDGMTGVRLFRQKRPELIITDIFMPEKDGLETILELKQEFPGVRIIAVSGGGQQGYVTVLGAATGLGADHILTKPFKNQALLAVIQKLVGETGVPARDHQDSVSPQLRRQAEGNTSSQKQFLAAPEV